MQTELNIYIGQECPGCDQALRIANMIEEKMPTVVVRIIDLTEPDVRRPESVFAVPTYVLNGKTVSLGNPDELDLLSKLNALSD
jgi:alkyl hydroperoxide reductase subunit AhpF